jgi:signal-transduction protein with cAMP-binding, CBS, and nucleotidyltransferase domain
MITAKPHATITSAARMMIKNKIKKLPITSSDELIGILSLTDLMPLLKKQKTANRFSLKDAPQRIKRVFDACIDPETQLRRRCPLIVMGDMATICMGTRCMWFDNGGCVLQSFVHQLLERQPNHKR